MRKARDRSWSGIGGQEKLQFMNKRETILLTPGLEGPVGIGLEQKN